MLWHLLFSSDRRVSSNIFLLLFSGITIFVCVVLLPYLVTRPVSWYFICGPLLIPSVIYTVFCYQRLYSYPPSLRSEGKHSIGNCVWNNFWNVPYLYFLQSFIVLARSEKYLNLFFPSSGKNRPLQVIQSEVDGYKLHISIKTTFRVPFSTY